MSQSTDGQICYGVLLEDGYEFPWGDKSHEDWWYEDVCGFKSSFHDQIYADTKTGYVNNVRPPQELFDKYFEESEAFQKLHPIPFELVNYCSGDYPMYILAIPSTVKSASRGFPEVIDLQGFKISAEEFDIFNSFCQKHGFNAKESKWYLSSYWG